MATNRTGFWHTSSGGWKTGKKSSGTKTATGYASVFKSFSSKIASYKCLSAQTVGSAKCTRPSPAMLNSFSKWIDKGATVHKVSAAQVKRWSKTNRCFKSAASAKSVMQTCFGRSTIKAVTCDKSGGFLVATPCVCKGKVFKFPQ